MFCEKMVELNALIAQKISIEVDKMMHCILGHMLRFTEFLY